MSWQHLLIPGESCGEVQKLHWVFLLCFKARDHKLAVTSCCKRSDLS